MISDLNGTGKTLFATGFYLILANFLNLRTDEVMGVTLLIIGLFAMIADAIWGGLK